jgi:hypothetical protein
MHGIVHFAAVAEFWVARVSFISGSIAADALVKPTRRRSVAHTPSPKR